MEPPSALLNQPDQPPASPVRGLGPRADGTKDGGPDSRGPNHPPALGYELAPGRADLTIHEWGGLGPSARQCRAFIPFDLAWQPATVKLEA